MTTFSYKSSTGSTVDIDGYVISPHTGVGFTRDIPCLRVQAGVTLNRYIDGVLSNDPVDAGGSVAAAGGGNPVDDNDTFSGNFGTTGYTVGEVVRALKIYGILPP